jgi:peptidoglycan/LPS O-acetylase OafA/YrhL
VSQDSNHPKYRPDVDGLRAVAVLSVVGFHAFPFLVTGGFVGVDVFFVISGYLISTIILNGLSKDQFSFQVFYARRVKRIFPALLTVLVAVSLFGWFALFPGEFRDLGRQVAAGSIFLSNFALWQESGYFDASAITKPLIHLWSLGIEEQFYIVWPLLLFFVSRWKLKMQWVVAIALLLSFAMNIALIGSDPVTTFYLPFTRFWELLAGGLLAWTILGLKAKEAISGAAPEQRGLRHAMSIAGLGLIGLAVVLLDHKSVFPGWWATLPVAGACLSIAAGPTALLNRLVLSNRVTVWFGLISYPLYLWHWPLLSFAHVIKAHTPAREVRAAAVLLSVALAWLTYKVVEGPIRFGATRRFMVLGLAAGLWVLGALGFWTYRQGGFPSSTRPEAPDNIRGEQDNAICKTLFGNKPLFNYCSATDQAPDIVVLGDSHAQAIYLGLVAEFSANQKLALFGNSGCPPLISTRSFARSAGTAAEDVCPRVYDQIFATAHPERAKQVFLVGRGRFYLFGDEDPDAERQIITRDGETDPIKVYELGLRDMITRLGNAAIFIVLENPTLNANPFACSRPLKFGKCDMSTVKRTEHLELNRVYREVVERASRDFPNVTILDPGDYFCSGETCAQKIDGIDLYADRHHLNQRGGVELIRFFRSKGRLDLRPP